MARRTDFQAAISYTGQAIKLPCEISYKVDGVRLLYRDGKVVTRNDKVPAGLYKALTPEAIERIKELGECELYKEGALFGDIAGMLERHNPTPNYFTVEDVYSIAPNKLDVRLHLKSVPSIPKGCKEVPELLKMAVNKGYEGLVIRADNRWYRVKPDATADVYVTGYFEQVDKAKNPKGCLGGFDTNWGKVTAFSDEMRKELWENPEQYVGKMITVTYKERYHTGKFRYCVTFNHFRTDKEEESFDTEPPSK